MWKFCDEKTLFKIVLQQLIYTYVYCIAFGFLKDYRAFFIQQKLFENEL